MSPRLCLCLHGYAFTVMYPRLCIHGYVSTVMYPRLCIHGYVSTVMRSRLCVHGYVSTVMSPRLCVHGYVTLLMYCTPSYPLYIRYCRHIILFIIHPDNMILKYHIYSFLDILLISGYVTHFWSALLSKRRFYF
jgi:hypothetical protein